MESIHSVELLQNKHIERIDFTLKSAENNANTSSMSSPNKNLTFSGKSQPAVALTASMTLC